ncbi:Sigma factor RpoE negative regulatory protein RseB precursor [Pseudomonas orientalis]|uniref:MucB/RseB C-terminal domain-containing protein n=1 Tax=Pseudomonas orientalis TaxID=76758 RepID=UPI000F55E175|nr:MucB/RseB C-terminal domain-containing protein [Pseudomonas orientalis]AZE93559.1 Sigma factor RpoE negative regulatory protein RseB precursor [Pseudomonas orientalis]
MRAIPLLTLLLSSWFALPAHADDAQDWLTRLGRAEQQQSFQGTFIYERNGSFSTHDIWHLVQNGQVRERLLQLDGSAKEVVRVDGHAQCVSGSLVVGLGNSRDVASRSLDPQKLNQFYELAVIGKSRVAGRNAVVVSITPRDHYRYGFELHLDRDTALPLKSLLLSEQGQLLERFQFVRLNTTAAPTDRDLQPSGECTPVAIGRSKAAQASASNAWHLEWLPPGFALTGNTSRKDPQTKSTIDSLMYDDGLARFSVFLESTDGASVSETRTQLGPTVAVSRHLNTVEGEIMVTVVGEIPIGTAERIALSVRGEKTAAKP